MRVALVDSGLGLLPTAAELRRLRPDLDLVLALDPDGMPWGPRVRADVVARLLASARAAARDGVDAVVVPCNTASVVGLADLRAVFEPAVPVIGTVPAVKPAAAAGRPFAIWATVGTTASDYQADLVRRFAAGIPVTAVPCPGLAEAVEAGAPAATAAAVADAAARTPGDSAGVVLGCTHYALAREEIERALPAGTVLYDSAPAVARQTLRRLGDGPPGGGTLRVLLSGRAGPLPRAARRYPAGRSLAAVAAA